MIAWLLIGTLLLLAALHAYWGVGGRWPGHDDTSFVEAVIGRTKDMRPPPPSACFGVAAALAACAALMFIIAFGAPWLPVPAILVKIAFWTACAVFVLRGLSSFVPPIWKHTLGTPFHRLNLVLYTPICLAIGAGFIWIGTATN